MTAGAALRAALADGYRQSARLVLLNCGVGVIVAVAAAAAAFALPAVVLVLAAGPVAAALVHCSVVLARSGDLDWRDALEGLRSHWRRGIVLAAIGAVGLTLGIVGVRFYLHHGIWPLAALALYLVACFCLWQLVAWPLAVTGEAQPLRRAAAELLRRPGSSLLLGGVLLAVNVVGAAFVIPLLTLTLAYSFLAAAHFVLPPDPAPEV